MAQDYKNAGIKKKKKKSGAGAPPWLWALAGLSIGLFVAFLVYLDRARPPAPIMAKTAPKAAEKAKPAAKAAPGKPGSPEAQDQRFEFYTLLPEMEVVVPEREQQPGGRRPPTPSEAKSGMYELQAGSFRRYAEADSRKAALALLGVESEIQRVTLDNNETWHRVKIGPYRDVAELNQIRSLLQGNRIETVLIKLRGKS